MTARREGYRLAGRSAGAHICGARFANPRPDGNLPTPTLVCTCAPGHEPPHVAHVGDLPAAIAFDIDGPAGRTARAWEQDR